MAAVPALASLKLSEQLGDFVANLETIPGKVSERAKHLMLDAIGCAYAARTQPFAGRLANSVARLAGPGPRGVIGLPQRLPLRDAAMVNGMLMHGLDYDDTHAAGVIHLTVSTLPAGLALAAQRGAPGAELLAAYIAGVEAGARIAAVAKGAFHQAGFHPTGLVGAFAAALVAGRLMGLSPAQLAGAQGIALSLASGSLQFLDDGAWTKRIHPGWAAAGGITAASLAADDIPAPPEAYEGRFGLYRSHLPPAALEHCDLSLATAGLGTVWEIENVAVKPFPACHLLHACADAAIALHRAGVDPERVRSVRARVPEGVVSAVCEPVAAKRRPKSDYDAKFSIPYAVASGLARGRLGLAELEPEALVEPRIEKLMDKVDYEIDPDADFPRYYGGEVIVALDDGRTLSHRVPINRGNPERPLTNAEVEAKFFDNCALTLDAKASRRIRDLVLGLDKMPNVAQLEEALSCPPDKQIGDSHQFP
jgi:2-methylcitrate dehydratase PrpD